MKKAVQVLAAIVESFIDGKRMASILNKQVH